MLWGKRRLQGMPLSLAASAPARGMPLSLVLVHICCKSGCTLHPAVQELWPRQDCWRAAAGGTRHAGPGNTGAVDAAAD